MTSPTFINPEVGFAKPTRVIFSFVQVEETLPDLAEAKAFVEYVYPIDRKKQLKYELKKEKVFLEHFIDSVNTITTPDGFEILNQCIPKITMFHTLLKVDGCVESVKRARRSSHARRIMIVCSYSDAVALLKQKLKEAGLKSKTIYNGVSKKNCLKYVDMHAQEKLDVLIIKPEQLDIDIKTPHVDELVFLTTSNDVVDNTQAIMRCYSTTKKEALLVKMIALYRNPVDSRLHRLLMRHIVHFFKSISANVVRRKEKEF